MPQVLGRSMEIALIQSGMVSKGQEKPEIRTAIIELQTIMIIDDSRVLKNPARACPSRITDSRKGSRKMNIFNMSVRIGKSQIW